MGGIERYSANVAADLVARGWQVDVLACAGRSEADRATPATDRTAGSLGDAPARLGASGECIYELSSLVAAGRLPVPLPTPGNARILRALGAGSYDLALIQSHLFVSGLLAVRIGRGARRVWLNHGSGHVPAGTLLMSKAVAAYEHVLAWLLRPQVDVVAAVSVEAAQWLRHVGVRDASSVGNAVAAVGVPRRGREPGPLRVLYAGRLEPGKGADDAIAIVRSAADAGPIELTICGGGSERTRIEALAAEAPDGIDFPGAVPHEELLERMQRADVFLYPSRYPEGFPTVLLEAGAQGCAVLTYPVAGTAELLRDGGGWRVADRAGAVDALRTAAAEPWETTAIGETMRASIAARFTWHQVVARLLGEKADR